ncbi:unnamed protein product [Ambrosiozyma monospora]|uniref:Unnamed protein product n=1 Tax=Ambrosiozyma monospora TaxID=43982 RepID=A0A9W6Z4B7_AMBMO|nr:unnamed protein product [Ambrosiozyma monospora]
MVTYSDNQLLYQQDPAETRQQLLFQFSKLNKQQLVEKLIDLEMEFRGFVEESKEMEDFLESELQSNSDNLSQLKSITEMKDNEITNLNQQLLQMNRTINMQSDAMNSKTSAYESQLNECSKKLVSLEIQNEAMENEHRIQHAMLKQEIEKNNELLERLANQENEMALLKQSSMMDKQIINQLRYQVNEHHREISDLGSRTDEVGKLKQIAKLMAVNRHELKVARYQTPPLMN